MGMNYVEFLAATNVNELNPREKIVPRLPPEQNDMYSTVEEHVSLRVTNCAREANRAVEPCRIQSLQYAERKSFSPSPAVRFVQEVENSHAPAVLVAWNDRGTQIDLQAADRIRPL
jgi:hypothetical protein